MPEPTEVERLRQENAELKAQITGPYESFEADVEVTACMLAWNSWRDLWDVLTAYWHQGVSLALHTVMDQTSIDPTETILSADHTGQYLCGELSHTIRSYRYLGTVPHYVRVSETNARAMAVFVDACKTEFIFFNDSDVLIPNGALKALIAEMREDASIGALGIPYEQEIDHVQKGAMLMRTSLARDVGFNGKTTCECRELAKRLAARDLRMTHWKSREMAVHLKYRR